MPVYKDTAENRKMNRVGKKIPQNNKSTCHKAAVNLRSKSGKSKGSWGAKRLNHCKK